MTRERPAYYELGYGEDFGLTALTERLSRPGSATGPAAALGFAEELADRSEGEEAVELGEDARRLLASELPERVLHTVWLASPTTPEHGGATSAPGGTGVRNDPPRSMDCPQPDPGRVTRSEVHRTAPARPVKRPPSEPCPAA
ncbi:hypothetical protein [Streptomyces avidinii]